MFKLLDELKNYKPYDNKKHEDLTNLCFWKNFRQILDSTHFWMFFTKNQASVILKV